MQPINTTILNTLQLTNKTPQQKQEKVELTRAEIISSKDLTPEQKLERLGIKPMTTSELASGLTYKILDGEV